MADAESVPPIAYRQDVDAKYAAEASFFIQVRRDGVDTYASEATSGSLNGLSKHLASHSGELLVGLKLEKNRWAQTEDMRGSYLLFLEPPSKKFGTQIVLLRSSETDETPGPANPRLYRFHELSQVYFDLSAATARTTAITVWASAEEDAEHSIAKSLENTVNGIAKRVVRPTLIALTCPLQALWAQQVASSHSTASRRIPAIWQEDANDHKLPSLSDDILDHVPAFVFALAREQVDKKSYEQVGW